MKRKQPSILAAGIAVTLLALGVFVAVALASEDPYGGGPGNFSGEWVLTPYSEQSQNLCNAAAGEICMEWCWTDGRSTPTGLLCCVADGECRSAR